MDSNEEQVYSAGHVAPPGAYRRVDVPYGRTVTLVLEEPLPASCDGAIAQYQRVYERGDPSNLVGVGPRLSRRPAVD